MSACIQRTRSVFYVMLSVMMPVHGTIKRHAMAVTMHARVTSGILEPSEPLDLEEDGVLTMISVQLPAAEKAGGLERSARFMLWQIAQGDVEEKEADVSVIDKAVAW
jgi:hypothetical protein